MRPGKRSHTVWEHPLISNSLVLSGQDGDDANNGRVVARFPRRISSRRVIDEIRDMMPRANENGGVDPPFLFCLMRAAR